MTTCNICGGETNEFANYRIMGKYDVRYFHCGCCDFVQTEKPYWLSEAYSNSINLTDTGYAARNIFLSKKTLLLFLLLFGKNNHFLDYAGGYGLFVRLMRDFGLDFYWSDLYTQNIFANGFSYNNFSNFQIKAVTCFECFEHFVDPIKEIEKILSISRNVFFSTRIFDVDKVPSKDWEYYGFEHGQHISFYSKKTLKYLASKYNLNYYTNNDNIHLFTEKKVGVIFKLSLFLSKTQLDLVVKKFLKTKMISDSKLLKI